MDEFGLSGREQEVKDWEDGFVFGKETDIYNPWSVINFLNKKVALTMISFFDTGKNPSQSEPERFYHGFVLGLIVELADHHILISNRESGCGRNDVALGAT